MKPRFCPVLFTALTSTLVGLSGCNQNETVAAPTVEPDVTTQPVPDKPSPHVAEFWEHIKDATFESREQFANSLARMSTEWSAELPTVSTPQNRAAVEEFRAARVELDENLRTLRDSTAETWSTAKGRVDGSWQRLQRAFKQLEEVT